MKIILKPNNRPTKPGVYLCKGTGPNIKLYDVRRNGRVLEMSNDYNCHAVTRAENSLLWSDALEIEVEKGK